MRLDLARLGATRQPTRAVMTALAAVAGTEGPVGVGGTCLLPIRETYHDAVVAERFEEAEALRRLYPDQDFSHFLGHWQALRTASYKYVRRADMALEALYDLAADPDEMTDCAARLPDVATQLRMQLDSFLARASPPAEEPAEPDTIVLKRLEALGYL